MKDRVITAVIIGAVFIGVVLLSLAVEKLVFDVFVLILMFCAMLEVKKVLEKKYAKAFGALPVLAIFLGYALYYILQKNHYPDFAIWGFLGAEILMFLIAVLWSSFDKTKTSQNVITTAIILVYPIMMLCFMLELNYITPSSLRSAAIVLLFLTTTFTDMLAFLVGVKVGGRKLAPKISPKKTVSGAIGGIFGGILAGLLVYLLTLSGWLDFINLKPISSNLDPLHFILIGLLGSVFTQAGDLLASYVKRRAGVKDYGRFLKGHGGIMDRIDGMMLNAFIINLYMMLAFSTLM